MMPQANSLTPHTAAVVTIQGVAEYSKCWLWVNTLQLLQPIPDNSEKTERKREKGHCSPINGSMIANQPYIHVCT